MPVRDRYGRKVSNLRISITQRCNLNCSYCHREGQVDAGEEMTVSEILKVVKAGKKLGIDSIKLTGGEPLLREDVLEIISGIRKLGIEDVSMVTNGTLLEGKARALARAGLKRVNVSCDFPEYSALSKKTFGKVKKGILEAKRAGLGPIKLNMLVMKGMKRSSLWRMLALARKSGVILQLIELIDTDRKFYREHHRRIEDIEKELASRADKVVEREFQGRKKYFVDGAEVEVVSPMHNSVFCAKCSRIRLTSDGKLKPCLMRSDNLVDVIGQVRKGATLKQLEKLFLEAVKEREPYWKPFGKPFGKSFEKPFKKQERAEGI